jgi:hypothetical protein
MAKCEAGSSGDLGLFVDVRDACVCTVDFEMNNSPAICLSERPPASRRKTSISRSVNPEGRVGRRSWRCPAVSITASTVSRSSASLSRIRAASGGNDDRGGVEPRSAHGRRRPRPAAAPRRPGSRPAPLGDSRIVDAFVVHPGKLRQRMKGGRPAEDPLRVTGVEPNLLPLSDGERAVSLPDPGWDAHASKVVEERGSTDRRDRGGGQTHGARGSVGQGRHAGGMAVQERQLQVGGVGEGARDLVELMVGYPPGRARLGFDRGNPRISSS